MDTPSRLLRLLGLLSSRSWWGASELAAETGVTERTVRRDVTRLRDLGYPVEATTGRHGGYTLGRGGHLPPLVLDDDEAVAVALGLRAAAGGATGAESAALSALAKLDQVLPARLRERVAAVAAVTVGLRGPGVPEVDLDQLVTAGLACRRPERLRFTYRAADDVETERHVEPYRLVYTDQFWYLVAFDPARQDWRTFRVDRMRRAPPDQRQVRSTSRPTRCGRAGVPRCGRGRLRASSQRAAATSRSSGQPPWCPPPSACWWPRPKARAWHASAEMPTGSPATWPGSTAPSRCSTVDALRAELRALGRRLVREHR